MADLEAAVSQCCLLWGGLRNPIIPITSETDSAADELIRNFQVDVLLPVAETDEIEKFMARYELMRHPLLSARNLLVKDWRTGKHRITYLDVLHAIDKYWAQEFKHAVADAQSHCRLISWDENDPLRHLFHVSFGAYRNDLNLIYDFREAFSKGLRASEIHIKDDVPTNLIGTVTPAILTSVELTPYGATSNLLTGGVYLGDSDDVADLTTFWNVRAAGTPIEFVCLKHTTRCEAFVRAHLKKLDDTPQSHPNIPGHIGFFTRIEHSKAIAVLQGFPTKKRPLLHVLTNLAAKNPYQFSFESEFTSAFVEHDPQGPLVTLPLPERKFLANSQRRNNHQMMAVSIDASSDLGYPGFTLSPPYRRTLNEFYSREIMTDPWSIRSEEQGIGVCTTSSNKTLHLRPIKHAAVIEAVLGLANLNVEPSQAGRLTDRLLDALGGYEATRVFKIRGIRELIGSLNSQSQVTRGQATNAIWNNGQFKEHERLYIEPRDKPTLDANSAFDFLLKKNFFRAGLWLKCEQCRLENWLTLREIDDRWTCEYCGFSNITSMHIRDRGDWHFRKSGLLAKDNNQEGAIPVVLSLLALGRVLDDTGVLRSTSLNVKESTGATDCELDFLALRHREGEIECALGEAKAAGGEINDDDVSHLKVVSAALKNAGIDTHLVFSKTADAFTPNELDRFRAAQKEGHSVIILTNRELEPYNPYYESSDAEKLPAKYAQSLAEMSANSTFRYLSIPELNSPAFPHD